MYPTLLSSNNINSSNDPWTPTLLNKNSSLTTQSTDVLIPVSSSTPNNDPWAAFESSTSNSIPQKQQYFDLTTTNNGDFPPSYDSIILNSSSNALQQTNNHQRNTVKTPDHFLGENSALVNLDNLMGPKTTSKPGFIFL